LRRHYDADHTGTTQVAPAPRPSAAEPDEPSVPFQPLGRIVRPSALVLAVLMVIFVVTAYVGPHTSHISPATTTSTDDTATSLTPSSGQAGPLPRPIGDCLLRQPGYDAMVPCNQPNNGLVVA